MSVSRRMTCALLLGGALAAGIAPLGAQQPQAAVVPDAVTVGEVFRAAVRIELPANARVAAPDSLVLPEDLEMAGRREIRIDTADGVPRATVVYPLTAWRPGSYELPPLELSLVTDGREARHVATFPSITVRSVLPADTAGIEPREAKDVLGPSRLWWPILLALLIAAIIATALWYWWRKRRRTPAEAPALVMAPGVPPRQAALEQLAALRAARLIEQGEVKLFYERLSETLRHYVATRHVAWGVDLTTSELAQVMIATGGASAGGAATVELLRMLHTADLVKFARGTVTAAEAQRDLDAAVQWVEQAEPAVEEPGTEERRVA